MFDPKTPILIVDDSPQFAMVLSRLLSGVFGLKSISIVNSTDEALNRVTSNPGEFSLLFIDFHFPSGMNGGELLATLSSRDLLKGKIVFLMSSDPTAETLQQVLKAGAAGVITKPFEREELQRQLERASRLADSDDSDGFSQ